SHVTLHLRQSASPKKGAKGRPVMVHISGSTTNPLSWMFAKSNCAMPSNRRYANSQQPPLRMAQSGSTVFWMRSAPSDSTYPGTGPAPEVNAKTENFCFWQPEKVLVEVLSGLRGACPARAPCY